MSLDLIASIVLLIAHDACGLVPSVGHSYSALWHTMAHQKGADVLLPVLDLVEAQMALQ